MQGLNLSQHPATFAVLGRKPQPVVQLAPVMRQIDRVSLSGPADQILNSGQASSEPDQEWIPFGFNPIYFRDSAPTTLPYQGF
jgi:hypothetical protein